MSLTAGKLTLKSIAAVNGFIGADRPASPRSDRVCRKTTAFLLVVMLVWFGDGPFCGPAFGRSLAVRDEQPVQQQQIGVDTDSVPVETQAPGDAPTQDLPEAEPESPYVGPIEVFAVGRMDINLSQAKRLSELGSQIVGNSDWDDGVILMEIADEFDELRSDNAISAAMNELSIEILLATKAHTLEVMSALQIVVLPLPAADALKLFEEEMPGDSEFDADGFARIDDAEMLLLKAGDCCVFAQGSHGLESTRELMVRALQRFRESPPQKAFEFIFEPPQVPQRVRNLLTTMAIGGLSMMAQRRDSEEELPFRLREFGIKPLIAATHLLSEQIQSAGVSMHLNSDSQQVEVEFSLKAVPGSEYEQWLLRQQQAVSRTGKFLHPRHDTVFSLCVALPDDIRTQLPLLSKAAFDAFASVGLLSASSAKQCQLSIQDISNRGLKYPEC